MDFTKLTIGTKIYYTGDCKNPSSFGEITAITSSEWYPVQYDMLMLNGEIVKSIQPSNFGGLEHGGHRFRLLVESDQNRYQTWVAHYARERAEAAFLADTLEAKFIN